jgi:uncharacterized protein (DUF488 family)
MYEEGNDNRMSDSAPEEQLTIWTIGHSNRPIEAFLGLLTLNEIEVVADVRRFPGSRKHPQFGSDALRSSLAAVAIEYVGLPELGGRRQPRPDSRNTVWRNESFRGYADYMETDEFRSAVERLTELARLKRTALMCAELLWWRCHRALIADYLKSSGIAVRHIMDSATVETHPYTSAARLVDGKLSYAAGA